jgi:hypothetical protein
MSCNGLEDDSVPKHKANASNADFVFHLAQPDGKGRPNCFQGSSSNLRDRLSVLDPGYTPTHWIFAPAQNLVCLVLLNIEKFSHWCAAPTP